MQLRELKQLYLNELPQLYDEQESESIFWILLEHYSNLKRIDYSLNPQQELTIEVEEKFKNALSELKKSKPVQYITGKAHFFGYEFSVNENTLIPRPETEELIDWIIKENQISEPNILDIGTGSGCIPIALSLEIKNSKVTSYDVSELALATAIQNAVDLNSTAKFQLQDILSAEKLSETFDIIVSNPPYVRNLEKVEIRSNVLEHEPHLALFVSDDDPLIFYRKIAQLAQSALKPNGKLYFEINQYLGKETVILLEELGFKNIELRKDFLGNDRMIRATYS